MIALNTKFKALAIAAGLSASLSAFASSTITFDPTGNGRNSAGDIRIGAHRSVAG